jgi:hypothetical protein
MSVRNARKNGSRKAGASMRQSPAALAARLASAGRETRKRLSFKNKVRFDVFLCHNSKDKAQVRRLAVALTDAEIRPWFDEWHLVPGRRWQVALEREIRRIPAVAVLIGKKGVGPWSDVEMRAFLVESVTRKIAVIPVLLPGTPAKPRLPPFLFEFTWIDMRKGMRKVELDRLIWGITGIAPTHKRAVVLA